eukprot:PhF_6_TR18616/c0_g1_i1/m.27207
MIQTINLYQYVQREDDDFCQQSRKIMFVVCFVASIFSVIYFLYEFITLLLNPSILAADIVSTVGLGTITFGLFIGFFVACITKSAPDPLVEVVTLSLNSGFIMALLSTHNMPTQPLFFSVALATVMMQTPRYWFHLPYSFIGWMLSFYEQLVQPLGYPSIMMDDNPQTDIVKVVLRVCGSIVALSVLIRA